ncbi:sensory rhodopsin transducer [Streptomyces viridochromogenes]|uniref:sensory rhodopsin transducer n=1 Tax=Streptomyces viridochromogenes TaxID=1938 RepID=UPI00190F0FD6|nr:sensory rhodopsin transducer [Streptomyces viridochromogenes]
MRSRFLQRALRRARRPPRDRPGAAGPPAGPGARSRVSRPALGAEWWGGLCARCRSGHVRGPEPAGPRAGYAVRAPGPYGERRRPGRTPPSLAHAPAESRGPLPAPRWVTLFFPDREPAGPYAVTVPARRTRHQRFNEFAADEPAPVGADHASVLTNDVPVVVQHTRLDSRQPANALMSTIAYRAA